MAMKKTLGKSSGRSMLSGKTWKTWDVVLVIGFCLKPRTGFKKRQEKSRSDFQWSFTSCWQMACQPAHSKGWLFVYLTGECDQAGSKCEGGWEHQHSSYSRVNSTSLSDKGCQEFSSGASFSVGNTALKLLHQELLINKGLLFCSFW